MWFYRSTFLWLELKLKRYKTGSNHFKKQKKQFVVNKNFVFSLITDKKFYLLLLKKERRHGKKRNFYITKQNIYFSSYYTL